MSVADERTQPAYGPMTAPASYAQNPHILRWWSSVHDEALRAEISRHHWQWYWHASDVIVAVTPPEVLDRWRKTDPLCTQYAWYNVLMYFAVARAKQQSLMREAREPTWESCAVCGVGFREDSLPVPLVERLGIDRIDICGPCLKSVAYGPPGDPRASKEQVISYVNGLAELIQRVPHQGFGDGKGDFLELTTPQRVRMIHLFRARPTPERVNKLFGSWLGALVAAGVLEGGARRTSRGTQSLALDGHVCYSLGEKTIDDFLFRRGIAHDREPPYPEGAYRADFRIGDALVEYLGLAGDPEYDAKTTTKQEIGRRHGLTLLLILPEDLATDGRLREKLGPLVVERTG